MKKYISPFVHTGIALVAFLLIVACDESAPGVVDTFEFEAIMGPTEAPVKIKLEKANTELALRNLPRGINLTKLSAKVSLPAGYTITPNPTIAKNYTSPVTYTIKKSAPDEATYTLTVTALPYDSASNPYGVYTPLDLSNIRFGLNDNYVLINDITLPDLSTLGAVKTGISDYADYGWYQIGSFYRNPTFSKKYQFRGTVDGQNFVIKNYNAKFRNRNSPNPDDIDEGTATGTRDTHGLFGYAGGATFKNIGIQLGTTGIVMADDEGNSYSYVGALVGRADTCVFVNCYVTGNSTIKTTSGLYIGGLVGGMLAGTMEKCYADITQPSGNYAIDGATIGGLIGRVYSATVKKSYATCDIEGSGNAGGLFGVVHESTVEQCYATGNVIEYTYTGSAPHVAPNKLGGLIGNFTIESKPATIKNCYARGAVTGASDATANAEFHKGSFLGGMIGYAGTRGQGSGTLSVTHCYATGAVSRTFTKTGSETLIGGLAGQTKNNIFRSGGVSTTYWDKETTGQTQLGGGDANYTADNGFTANGKTTAEMKTQATYANWDFSGIWMMESSKNDGYPTLK